MNEINNADQIKFRCSSLGHIMSEGNSLTEKQAQTIVEFQAKEKLTEKQAQELDRLIEKRDNPELPTRVKKHLVDVFVASKYKRYTESYGKQLDKGNAVEEDSITIVSRATKTVFTKNEERLSNDFIQGCPDIFLGEQVRFAVKIHDTKSSWDLFSHMRNKFAGLKEDYKWQGTGYMDLTGAKSCSIDHCLINTPYNIVQRELGFKAFQYPGGVLPVHEQIQVLINHTYDRKTFFEYMTHEKIDTCDEESKKIIEGFIEIPVELRHFNFEFERNQADIDKLHNRVTQCRKWMNENLFNLKQLVL